MPVEESEEITKRFKDIERFRRAFADIEDCIERIEWESLKQKNKELMDEFQKTYAKFHQVRSQLRLNEEALKQGDISSSMFEKKMRELVGELSIVDLELDCMKPKLCRFILKIADFLIEEGMVEDKKEVMAELKEAMTLLESKNEWEKKMERRGVEREESERLERERKEREESERLERERKKEKIKEKFEERANVKKFCSSCGRENIKRTEFCDFCGAILVEKVHPEKISEEKTEVKRFCPNCGRENKNGSKYCKSCGTDLLKTGA